MTQFETRRGTLEIRELHGIAEMLAAERIQCQVWGTETIPHPKEILIPVQHEGGLLAGAFSASGELIGLIFGFPTRDPAAMHSQLLATLEDWRGLGIGAHLKWYQRDWCLERGIQQVRWTVDPLRAANAELNIRHLGGTANAYYEDYYGTMQGIDAGAPTDRLLIEWHLRSERVAARIRQTPTDAGFPDAEPAILVEREIPMQPRTGLTCPKILVRIPQAFVQISKSQPDLALSWRIQTREVFQHYFSRGYMLTEFTRVGGPAYLLEAHQPASHQETK